MYESTTVVEARQHRGRPKGRRAWLLIGILSVAFNLVMAARSNGKAVFFNLGLAVVWAAGTVVWDIHQARYSLS